MKINELIDLYAAKMTGEAFVVKKRLIYFYLNELIQKKKQKIHADFEGGGSGNSRTRRKQKIEVGTAEEGSRRKRKTTYEPVLTGCYYVLTTNTFGRTFNLHLSCLTFRSYEI